MKRKLHIVVISDVHLGTRGCHAKELLNYLKSIKPDTLILNGDFIDMWQFRKSYFPKEHLRVLNRVLKMFFPKAFGIFNLQKIKTNPLFRLNS